MKKSEIVSFIEGKKNEITNLPEMIPNVVKSAIFQAKIHTNGKKQIKIKMHTDELNIYVCNGGHMVSSKEFQDLKFSNYKIRILKKKPLLLFGEIIICDFLNIPVENNVIYWVSWDTKNHKELKNRPDIFCLLEGVLTNKLINPRNKINKKYSKNQKKH